MCLLVVSGQKLRHKDGLVETVHQRFSIGEQQMQRLMKHSCQNFKQIP